MGDAPMPTAMAQDFMKEITNFDSLLARFELDLRRQEVVGYDEKGQAIVKQAGNARLADEGIKDVVGSIRAILNSNTAYSYLEKDQFNLEMRQIAITTDIRLWTKMKDWNIEPSDYRPLCTMINNVKALAMRKAIGKNFQDFTSATKSTVENRIIEERSGGLLGGINWGNSQQKR